MLKTLPIVRSSLAPGPLATLSRIEHRAALIARFVGLPLLRGSLGLVFIWFGGLKVLNATPVADFVAGTIPWVDRGLLLPGLGAFEIVLGLLLIIGWRPTTISIVLVMHLTGTFLALVMQPEVAFQDGNPFLLTTEGEFVIKNMVLISAGLVLASPKDQSA